VRLTPSSLPSYARPDMTVDVSIEVARLPRALSVPASSVLERDGKTFVVVVENDRARLREVQRRGRNADRIAIEGIPENAWIVAESRSVSPNARVHVVRRGR
jgi:multidrug efflux pump subunit AcrA (membrane-fusion protein)